MYIKNHLMLKDKLTTVSLDETLKSAIEKIKAGNFLSLPVLSEDGKNFEGILMKEAIYRKFYEWESMPRGDFLTKTKVKDIFTDNYKSVHDDDYIEKASFMLRSFNTPFLPVFNSEEKFVGIVTHDAIFDAFFKLFGFGKGERILVRISDEPGQLAKLTDIFEKESVNIASLLVYNPGILNIQQVILTVETDDLPKIMDKLGRKGFMATRLDNRE